MSVIHFVLILCIQIDIDQDIILKMYSSATELPLDLFEKVTVSIDVGIYLRVLYCVPLSSVYRSSDTTLS